MTLPYLILLLVTLQRLGELVLSARHTRRLIGQGAFEVGRAHYPVMVALHAGWLLALWLAIWLAGGNRPVNLALLGVFIALQGLRVWVLATLGERWTTRIIVLPGAPLVTGGPFRWLRHPNYCVVAGEIAVLPLVFGLTGTALVFTGLNAAMTWVRIRTELRALYGPAANVAAGASRTSR